MSHVPCQASRPAAPGHAYRLADWHIDPLWAAKKAGSRGANLGLHTAPFRVDAGCSGVVLMVTVEVGSDISGWVHASSAGRRWLSLRPCARVGGLGPGGG